MAGAKREPSSLVQLAMQIGISVSIPASLRVRTTSSAASVPSTPSNLPPVGWVSRCEPRPTGGFDMSRPLRKPNIEPSVSTCTSQPRGLARVAEPVAHLLVLGARASAAARRLLAWRRISRFRESYPTAARNRSAGWMRCWSFSRPKTCWCSMAACMVELRGPPVEARSAFPMIVGLAKKEQDVHSEEMLPSLQARLAYRGGHGHDHGRRRQWLRAGQSGDPAGKTRGIVPQVLPAQPETLPHYRHVRCRRSPHSLARARSRYPHRRAALPGLARRRGGRGADRYHGALARRSRGLRARLLVFVRGSADGGRPADPPYRAQGAGADVPHQYRMQARRGRSPVRWWCRCGRSSRRTRSARCRSPRAFPPCMARRSISAIRIRSGSRISPNPITATRCRWRRTKSRCSGPAA